MSTRSNIIVKTGNTFSVIYVHNDGYFSGVGETLKEFYPTQELAQGIVELGDASFIGETVETSMFYGRDRNEKDVAAVHYSSLTVAKQQATLGRNHIEYVYYFNAETNVWEGVKNATDF